MFRKRNIIGFLALSAIIYVASYFLVLNTQERIMDVLASTLIRLKPLNQLQTPYQIHPYSWNQSIPNEENIRCVTARTNPSFAICIHDPKIDLYVSGSIAGQGVWESHHVRVLLDLVKKFGKNWTFVDIGANIGFHGFYAAALGMKVIAIEPNKVNHPLLHKTVKLNKFESKVTLFPYAMSDSRSIVHMRTEGKNLGNTFIESERITIGQEVLNFNVTSILLDDIQPFIKTKMAMLKLDVQGHECGVILGGTNFIKNVYVPQLLLEMGVTSWADPNCVKNMTEILVKLGYTNVVNAVNRQKLDPLNTKTWPMDTLWTLKGE